MTESHLDDAIPHIKTKRSTARKTAPVTIRNALLHCILHYVDLSTGSGNVVPQPITMKIIELTLEQAFRTEDAQFFMKSIS